MSQIDLAHALGVAANTVNRWEAGTRKIPPYLHLALEALSKQGESIMNETCPKCDGRGYTFEVRRMRGWGALHNQRVRAYQGGPRPNMRTDYRETFTQRCDCPAGQRWQEED
jgi:hypothetical protein